MADGSQVPAGALPEGFLDVIAERVQSERADATYQFALAAFRLGRETAGATPYAGDRDPDLADALGAATSLPRSELLPEVRRLAAQRARWQDLIDWRPEPTSTSTEQQQPCFKCGGTQGHIVDRAWNIGTDSPYRFMHAHGQCPEPTEAAAVEQATASRTWSRLDGPPNDLQRVEVEGHGIWERASAQSSIFKHVGGVYKLRKFELLRELGEVREVLT